MKAIRFVWFGVVLLGVSTIAAAQTGAAPASGQPEASTQSLYRLQPGDAVDVRFFFDPELNESVQIRPDGYISMQLIGQIEIAGKTVEQASSELQSAYSKQLKNPQVSVQVRSFAAQKIYVTGEVFKPGLINMPGQLTVMNAIGEAGGIKHTGNVKSVILIRKGPNGEPMEKKLALQRDGELTRESALLLQPFDIIMVPETKIAQIDRWVDQHIKQINPTEVFFGFSYVLHNPNPGFVPF